jgi:hypothetical protein
VISMNFYSESAHNILHYVIFMLFFEIFIEKLKVKDCLLRHI